MEQIRVRIAPSPTGDPHVGTAYAALFNYIFARQNKGSFVLRIEDTDQTRAKASSEQLIFDSLRWLGLNWNEGPDIGGSYGPYRQSERKEIYKKHCNELMDKGAAYRCFCSPQRLTEMRAEQKSSGKQTGYDGHCRKLSPAEIDEKLNANVPYVIRLKVPSDSKTSFVDELRGSIEFDNNQIDDQVLMKSDGFPTYHLANVVDDHLMKISHVIRAEEWIASTPKHVLLYKSFGWEEPRWVHLPLLRNKDKSKISKRKNPVSLTYYKRAGILPGALLNFLALMGWNPGGDIELFSEEEMIKNFKFKNMNLGGPVFDIQKLYWINQHYIKKLNDESFINYIHKELFNDDYLKAIKPLLLERITRFEEFVDKGAFFFNGSLDYKNAPEILPKGKTKAEFIKMVKGLAELLDELYEWKEEKIKTLLEDYRQKILWKPRDFFMPIRIITTGRKDSPPLTETLEVLGREIVRYRLRDVIEYLNH